MSTIGAVVLAAGRSTRMGSHKLLLPLGDRPIITYIVNAAVQAPVKPVVVVLGHNARSVHAALPAGAYSVVENPGYAEGLATSLHAGILALPDTVDGVVMLLGDQPLLNSSHIAQIVRTAAQTTAPVVAATYGGRRGHPIYFARSCFPELLQVSGDEGGRTVVDRHAAQLVAVPIDDMAASLDLDDPSDYARMCELWARRYTV